MSTNHATAAPLPVTRTPATPAPAAARLPSFLGVAVFDIVGPYLAYSLLRSHGVSAAMALVLSGTLPALGVITGVIRRRRADVLGVLVLSGIVVGAILGLVTGSPRLILLEGSVPTALIALAFLGSLLTSRPLIFRLAAGLAGPDTPRGQEIAARWAEPRFRQVMRRLTAVWGVAYLAEAVARVIIVEHASTGTALITSKVMTWAVTGALLAGTFLYRQRSQARRARQGA